MAPGKRRMPGRADQYRRVQALRRAVRNARAIRETRRVVIQESVLGRSQEMQAGSSEPSVDSMLVLRAITVEDIITVIIGVL